jgi:rhodanese-related sulfurtransferase
MLAFSGMGSAVMANKLKIEVMQEGDGDVAEHGQRVTVHYEGRLTDDTVFDASRPRGHPFSFTIGAGQVIQGWEQGVTGMKVGEMRRLTIPAELGYGATGAGGVIPAHATLVFDIELLTVNVPVSLGQATPSDLLQAQKDGVVIVDIRRPDEWLQTGVIAGAETITAFEVNGNFHPDFKQQFMMLVPTPETPVLLYCLMGARTSNLGMLLIEQLGFLQVTHLSEGIMGWTADGYETIAYKP